MVETRRRKAAQSEANLPTASPPPSTTGRTVENEANVSYADMYRQEALERRRLQQSNLLMRVTGAIYLWYHQQAMTWGWYMLDTWETLLLMSILLIVTYCVLSACLFNPSSICASTLAAARNSLAAHGAKLLAYTR